MESNWLLGALSPACQDFFRQRVLTKPINSGEVLMEADAPLQNLIFPHDGLVSLRSRTKDGRFVETITIGRDGALGSNYLLGVTRFPWHTVTVISGRASWLPVRDFAEAMEQFPCVGPAVFACMSRMFRRMTQSVVCASMHSAHQRISTWLLHAHDRVRGKSFDITQHTLADIFGLRQATVSEACNRLLTAGAIHYSRGCLSILDRALLEAQACECYEAVCLRNLLPDGDAGFGGGPPQP